MDAGTSESLEQMQSRHRKEAKDLQGRVTNKKKNATKKTRKGVNDECAEMEKQMKDRHADELRGLNGGGGDNEDETAVQTDDAEEDGAGAGALADRMRTMGVGGLAAKPPQKPTGEEEEEEEEGGGGSGGGGGGAGKKRNRQKERLARRAAEQETAAAAAEQEAAGMTDHRGAEKKYMEGEFRKHGLVEREIRPDGHCLFSAVADQLRQRSIPLGGGGEGSGEDGEEEPGYRTVRRRAAGYIGEHGDDYAGFLEEDVESYVRKMRDTAEWGGQIELLAVANVYGVEIHVVQDGQTEVIRPAAEGEAEGEDKRIWLAYYRHGYGLGEHYNSLRKKA